MNINGKSLLKDKKGNANVIILGILTIVLGFGMLTIGTYLYYQIATSANAGNVIAHIGSVSSGNVTFNGNVSNGDLFNFTNGAATYIFEFNSSVASPSVCANANCIIVNVYNSNNSIGASANLTTVINANASVGALITATNSPANVTSFSADTRGTAGNLFTLSRSGANFNVSGTNMTGGVNDLTGQASQNTINSYVNIVFPLMGLALMILGFGVIFYTLRGSFGIGQAPR